MCGQNCYRTGYARRTTNPTAELAQPDNVPSFLVQPYSQEQLLDLAQRQAMTAFKEKALEKVKEAQRRAEVQRSTSSISEKRRKLKELLASYASDKKNFPKEYYERRALILAGTEPANQWPFGFTFGRGFGITRACIISAMSAGACIARAFPSNLWPSSTAVRCMFCLCQDVDG